MATQNLYLNENSDSPASAFVKSEEFPSPIDTIDLTFGDKPKFNIYIVNGAGGFATDSGAVGSTVKVGLGELAGTAVAFQDVWTLITDGWTGTLELNTGNLKNLLGNDKTITLFLEIEVTDASSNIRTYGQQAITIHNQVVDSASAVPTPNSSYLTSVEVYGKFVQNQSGISGLTGGGSTKLDGIATLALSVGQLVVVTIGTVVDYYRLKTGTSAEDSPQIIRPDDYATTTNEKYWDREQHDVGYTFTQVAPTDTIPVTHNLGYRPLTINIWIGNELSLAGIVHDSDNQFTITFDYNWAAVIRYR